MTGGEQAKKVSVVTGASSGIGAVLVRMLADRGDQVVLVARRKQKLEELAKEISEAGGSAVVRVADLAEPGVGEELVGWIDEELGRLDFLVNNAGFGKQAWLTEMDLSLMEQMFRVNVLGLIELSRAAVPLMKKGGGGSIVNVASVGGLVSHPLNVVYCSTKHAVMGFSKSLRLELKGSGINVVAVCPAATRTEFFERAKGEIPFDPMIQKNWVPAEKVAEVILRAENSRRAVVFPSWGAWFLCWADKWIPWASEIGNVRYRGKVVPLTRPEESGKD